MERRGFSRNSTTLKLTSGRRVEAKAGLRDWVEDRLVTWCASSIRERLGEHFLQRHSSAQGPDCIYYVQMKASTRLRMTSRNMYSFLRVVILKTKFSRYLEDTVGKQKHIVHWHFRILWRSSPCHCNFLSNYSACRCISHYLRKNAASQEAFLQNLEPSHMFVLPSSKLASYQFAYCTIATNPRIKQDSSSRYLRACNARLELGVSGVGMTQIGQRFQPKHVIMKYTATVLQGEFTFLRLK
jgi:hypothetical protein